jgi:hypothetical protein
MNRGEIYLALAPTFDGSAPKTRPFLVVQADFYNRRINKVLLAPITSNLARKNDPAHFLIEVSTPEGKASEFGVLPPRFGCQNFEILEELEKIELGELSAITGELPRRVANMLREIRKRSPA